MHLRHPNSVAHVRLLVKAPWKRYVVAAFFVAYYACSLKLWQDTVGQPHQWALEEQKRLIKEKAEAAKEKGLSFTSGQQDRKELPGCMGWAVKPRLVVLYKGLYYPVIRELL
eukprot:symbB.v1.2.032987.t1/scaffold4035.1/size45816/3